MSKAYIVFEFRGQIYEYDGDLPEEVYVVLPEDMFDEEGFWRAGYPDSLEAQMKDERDSLPSARWDIERVGGKVLEVHGVGENGAIHEEAWKRIILH